MKKIKVAVYGYGNIGSAAVNIILQEKDMELSAVISSQLQINDLNVVSKIEDLSETDVILLCLPSRQIQTIASQCLQKGYHTVDCFDIHEKIYELKQELSNIAISNRVSSIIASGWDPGTDSIMRCLMQMMAPKGITYTNFGPGMSMGHSVAAKAIEGVKDALSVTIPLGAGLHRRLVYVQLKEGYDMKDVSTKIKQDPYFIHSETMVILSDDINALKDKGHGVSIERKAASGPIDNQNFLFQMKINNPYLTAQIMVSSARAVMKQKPGAYTLIEIPPIDFLFGELENIINTWV